MNATLYDTLLWLHIAAGFIGLGTGLGAMLASKTGPRHKQWGRVYVGAMGVTGLSAMVLAWPNNLFLFAVGVFSLYLAYTGYRIARHKHKRPTTVDWVALGLMAAAGLGLLTLGGRAWAAGDGLSLVPLVFGGLALTLSVQEARGLRTPTVERDPWWRGHISYMGAAYIATFTAFAVTNFDFVPPLARWLVPTVIGTVAIVLAQRRYRKKWGIPSKPQSEQVESTS